MENSPEFFGNLLVKALRAHDLEKVRARIKLFTALDYVDKKGSTPLMYAARNGYKDVVQELLEKGVQIDTRSKYGKTALYNAVMNEHVDVVELLLNRGANANISTLDGDTALHCSLKCSSKPITKLLLKHGANPNEVDLNGTTVLMLAAFRKDGYFVKLLLGAGANPNMQDADGCTALMLASSMSHYVVARELINAGVNLDLVDKNGYSAYAYAIKKSMLLLLCNSSIKNSIPSDYSPEELSVCTQKPINRKSFAFNIPCPKCRKLSYELLWFTFRTPDWTWQHLCGREGYVSFCPTCHIQVQSILTSMN